MTWIETTEIMGNVGEFVGSIAVVATLIYLVVQIQQNTKEIRHSAFREAIRDQTTAIDLLCADPNLTRIWYDGLADYEAPAQQDRRRFDTYLTSVMRRLENLLYELEQGNVDDKVWLGIRGQYVWLFTQSGFKSWWGTSAPALYNDSLRAYVSGLVAENVRS